MFSHPLSTQWENVRDWRYKNTKEMFLSATPIQLSGKENVTAPIQFQLIPDFSHN